MKSPLRVISVILILLTTLVVINIGFAQNGTWSTKASMPTARGSLGVGVVGGKLYAVGGFNNGSGALATVEAYNPLNDTWSTVAPMSTPRNTIAVGVVNGLLYAVGGDTDTGSTGYLASVEAYDPMTNTWAPRAPMPTPRDALSVGVVNGKLYALGGQFPNGVFLSTNEAYDPVTDAWTTKAPMPTPRFFFGVGVINNILYVVGGHDGSAYSSTVEAYDPVTDTWSTKAPLPTTRVGPAVAVVNDILYVMGGDGGGCGGPCSGVEAYNPATDTWTTVSSMPTVRGLLAGGTVAGRVYAVGGRDSLDYVSTVEAFTSDTTPTPTPPGCTAPPPNMVSWWPGDGDANDIQGGNDGTLQGGATASAAGEVSNAFSFAGVGDYVDVPNSPDLQITSALTIDAWINPSTDSQIYGAGILSKGSAGAGGYAIDIINGDLRFFFYDATDPNTAYSVTSPGWLTPAKVNTWSHVAATYDSSSGELKLYDGGSLIATTTITAGTQIQVNNHGVSIGSRQSGNGPYDLYFAGSIDEVEIFNRALSQPEIQSIFNAGSAGKCKVTPTPTPEPTPTPTPTPEPTPTPTPTPGPTPTPQVGPPTSKEQCKDGGWQTFNTPRAFANQGDCVQFVNTGK